jgi:hypothetical protein
MADYDVKPHAAGGWQVVRRGRGARTSTRHATCAAAQAAAWLHAGADGGMLFVHGHAPASARRDALRSPTPALAAALAVLAPARGPAGRAALLAVATALLVARPSRLTDRPAA